MKLNTFLGLHGAVPWPHYGLTDGAETKVTFNMSNLFPSGDADFRSALDNFVAKVTINTAALGLVAGDLTAVTAALADYTDKLTSVVAKRNELTAAVTDKDNSRDAAEDAVRVVADKIRHHASAPTLLVEQLGMTIKDGEPTPVDALQPIGLFVQAGATGTNVLKWKANGNRRGVVYQIQAMVGDATAWSLIDTATKCMYRHEGNTPGVRVAYRVRARTAGRTSDWSEPTVAYGPNN